ncbi:hypothetical protein EPUS_00124 [Endocarpon pusillum Z07020]|uniref:Allantoicase domain-containing protein n=1 Tax=Endocarpon pusillum (strain Z07020 / HMAS-L-300199) TaxID=1263415 RepID=U1GCM1_ENDPU|nr:uncharacterized protein EPUS_00124 [Endocarpon pusillum Z07020]ERF75332.1 hypothetical protein EPUS_00124 [Endocarpon pusillum Z07020]
MEVPLLSPSTISDTIFPSTPTAVPASQIDATFSQTTNLTSSVLNARIHSLSDEYFASAANLLTPTPAVRKPGVYVHSGAWYDGWETRRHNPKPFLGCVGTIEGVEVDTAHFSGNEAPEVGLDGYFAPGEQGGDAVSGDGFEGWSEVLPRSACGPDRRQAWRVRDQGRQYTHLRLKMYPDGGIARLRVYGHAVPPPLDAVMAVQGDGPGWRNSRVRCMGELRWSARTSILGSRVTSCCHVEERIWEMGGRLLGQG